MHRGLLRSLTFHFTSRRFSTRKQQVRVRFAPSPTGHLHLGGLRTALYNYLFARANNGSFILRIEDTDQARVVPGAMEKLQEDLFWAGIIPDEDPLREGPTGPYIQSKRLELYSEQVKKLLNNGSAYHCFCTERRLELLRKEALRQRQVPKYDNKCRHLTQGEVEERLAKGEKYCIRFKLDAVEETFDDLVYGQLPFDAVLHECDPVIVKTDGYPTYHFANVVDDHFMEISHVLRGVEWQISTPKHILLYRAFGWEPPKFGHLPLILNPDGSKLSKRQGDIMVDDYRKNGIFPIALVNYITQAGGGFHRDNSVHRCYSYEELIKQFDVKRINMHSSKLAPERLLQFNKLEIANLLENPKNHQFLVNRVSKLVMETFPNRVKDGSLQLDEEHIITTLKWASNRISKLSDLVDENLAFLWVIPATAASSGLELKYLEAIKVLSESLAKVEESNFCKEYLAKILKQFAENNEVPFPNLMKALRSALSGLKDGPAVGEMMEILGREQTLIRLRRLSSAVKETDTREML